MMDASIPDGAEILHEGSCFRLARVSTPPTSLGGHAGQRQ